MDRIRPLLAAAAVVLTAVAASPETARAESRTTVGLKFGGNWSRLTRPDDAEGEPTLMRGTAFGGIGFTGGLSYRTAFGDDGPLRFALEVDALYSWHRATGFEAAADGSARRTLELTAHVLRTPLLASLQFGTIGEGFAGYLGLGPELWAGLESDATAELEGASGSPGSIQTTPAVHGTVHAQLGVAIPTGSPVAIPVEVRAVWDPFVGDTTVERFEGFESIADPGRYQVAFDWQILVVTGIPWSGL